jgi:hypothetical protein
VSAFCRTHNVQLSYATQLETALKARIPPTPPPPPPPLLLLLGVITPIGERQVLGVPEGSNYTVETGTFCARFDPSADVTATPWCVGLLARVNARLEVTSFVRRVLLVVPVESPDSRKLQLVLREGEQHDLLQFVADFFEHYYRMPTESVYMMANEAHKRLPAVALQIPVGLSSQRQVSSSSTTGSLPTPTTPPAPDTARTTMPTSNSTLSPSTYFCPHSSASFFSDLSLNPKTPVFRSSVFCSLTQKFFRYSENAHFRFIFSGTSQ